MIPLSLEEIARIVGGRVVDADPDVVVSGPAFLDTRTPEEAGLFVAFVGERRDGHDYAEAAVRSGAAAFLGSRETGAPGVVVDDTQRALQELARVVLVRLREREDPPRVVAITGSQGKTSAKDMLARVLADADATVATAGSFNNELGMPLTVLRTTVETRFLVLEMGARGIGHLADLCHTAPPDISLVLNVGKAHIGEFGSQQNIALAKGELVEALGDDGTAVLNADDPLASAMASRTRASKVTFGRTAGADVRVDGVELDDLGRPSFELTHQGHVERISLRLAGAHQATNAAAVAATALAAGLGLPDIARSLQRVETLSRWRMEIRERPDGLVVVNDAYNANPDSMRAAIETLARMGSRAGRRTVAVLGEMRELGPSADEEHRAVGELAHTQDIDRVVLVGPGTIPAYDVLASARADDGTTRHVDTVDEAAEWLRENVSGSDVVLLKASRSEGLERLADLLIGEETAS